MYINSNTLRTVAWSLALTAAQASYIIDNLSFGHKDGLMSPNLRGIPHWAVSGDSYDPEILSDRIILTPPYPGNRRGAIWSEDPLHHDGDWTAELEFRASGMERGGGNLQIWYTKESQKGQVPASLYTAPKFDGLTLLLDQYEGRGGSIRGFLNDGTIDFKGHHNPDTLSFGQCNYPYRNLGRFSILKLEQSHGVFKVSIDGNSCFSTDKVHLPNGYHFGITASSAENPDSFEIHKFVVATTNTYTREEPGSHIVHNGQGQGQEQFQKPPTEAHDDRRKTRNEDHAPPTNRDREPTLAEIPNMLSDVLAGSIRSQSDQFADLHNRVQILNHRINDVYNLLEKMDMDLQNRYNELMGRVIPMHDMTSAIIRNVEKVERISMAVQRDLESKDFKDMLSAVHRSIEEGNNVIQERMPLAMAHIVGQHKPSMTRFLFIAVAVQIMIVGAYLVYKKRRNGGVKKYL